MRPDSRALVFDLDNTLYPVRDFAMSAFRAVATRLLETHRLPEDQTLWLLTRAYEGTSHGRELQLLLQQCQLPHALLPELISLIRSHTPDLHLPAVSLRMLEKLRATWRLAVLTNGHGDIQARKVAALGVADLVDAVVHATTVGDGAGKPSPDCFHHVADALGVSPDRIVVVGDDERCDIAGAKSAGMRSVRLTAWTGPCRQSAADAVIASLVELPAIAESLVRRESMSHVA
jgi:putative hydrolase of the HAD superfamily